MTWSAAQYSVFEAERTRPVRDLLSAVPGKGLRTAVDIGCGPGNSTEVLAARYPGARVRGIDSSPDMIAAARKRLPQLQFDIADIASWDDPGRFDLVLANAVLQWLPDHAALLPRLIAMLAPGGSLAVQVPDRIDVAGGYYPRRRVARPSALVSSKRELTRSRQVSFECGSCIQGWPCNLGLGEA